jgi:hypothetical protein
MSFSLTNLHAQVYIEISKRVVSASTIISKKNPVINDEIKFENLKRIQIK